MLTTKFKTLPITFLFATTLSVSAQFNADFEDVLLNGQGINNGSNLQGGYTSGNLVFKNEYDATFQSWFGFAASSITDSTTVGYTNQYGSYAGSGGNGSQKFAVAYLSTFPSVSYPTVRKIVGSTPSKLVSFQYTNNTYAALSMKNGDAVAKKFGGVSGNEPDFYKMVVRNHYNGQITDTAEIFLADFRFADNSQDYIVKGWRTATFNFTTEFDSLTFDLTSSDNGTFGMNTPAYFCIDNLNFDALTEVDNQLLPTISLYPNPAHNKVVIKGLKENSTISIFDLIGRNVEVKSTDLQGGLTLEVSSLPDGVYHVRSNNRPIGKFVKN